MTFPPDQVIVRWADTAATPWANGGGETVELVSFSQSVALSGDNVPRWRLSVATLTQPAPFSPLPGVLRTFVPQAPVEMEVDGQRVQVSAGEPLIFDGSSAVALVALAAPCHAINLMVEHSSNGHQVELESSTEFTGTPLVFLVGSPEGNLNTFDLVAPVDISVLGQVSGYVVTYRESVD